MSHLTRGAWIEITGKPTPLMEQLGRTSHEVRGLKYDINKNRVNSMMSHLTRGAWIEMSRTCLLDRNNRCRTSHEVRGLKLLYCEQTAAK